MNLEWLKKHPYAAAGIGIAALIVFVIVLRSRGGSSTDTLDSAIAAQNQGQLAMAQTNAQLSAQSEQTQAQLAAQEYSIQAQESEQQNALVGQIAGAILPYQAEAPIYQAELTAQANENAALLPLEQQALTISTKGNRAQTGEEELALLLGSLNPQIPFAAGGLPPLGAPPKGFGANFNLGPLGFGFFG